jgi:23S rRNA (uracil1939-C5)-methyltransferase
VDAHAFQHWLADLSKHFQVRSPTSQGQAVDPQLWQAVTLEASRVHLRVQPGVFTQVNWHVNALLIEDALACARAFGALSFLDVFCGIGNFALPLLRAGLVGKGLDDNEVSIECARAAAREQALNAHFEACPALDGLRRLQRRRERFDLVVVDPPRAGLGDALQPLSALATRGLFYCACDPVSFARDAKRLCDLGFSLDSVRAYDLFPQTHHVELTAWFSSPRPSPGR